MTFEVIFTAAPNRVCKVVIGSLDLTHLKNLPSPSSAVLITDSNVFNLYGSSTIRNVLQVWKPSEVLIETIGSNLGSPRLILETTSNENAENQEPQSQQRALVVVVSSDMGEQAKSLEVAETIFRFCAKSKCSKSSLFIAVGGGVICDLTGFVASTYHRGCSLVLLPTSLLAMADACLGGKTAVNLLPLSKNAVGTFMQPKLLLIDPSHLRTLPSRILCEGIAEIVKCGVIGEPSLLEQCKKVCEGLNRNDEAAFKALEVIVTESLRFKSRIVTADERDDGQRAILNFGHTVGHAIEAQPSNGWLHGECVSVGMVIELMALRALGICGEGVLNATESLLAAFKLPTRIPSHIDADAVIETALRDKKAILPELRIVAVRDFGIIDEGITVAVPPSLFRRLLSPSLSVKAVAPVVGHASLPGSKSIANRALLLCALSRGTCRISNVPASEDVGLMRNIIASTLGAKVEQLQTKEKAGATLNIRGLGWIGGNKIVQVGENHFVEGSGALRVWVQNAGTVARFLPAVCACLLCDGRRQGVQSITFDGDAHMRRRPFADLLAALADAFTNLKIRYLATEGCVPFELSQTDPCIKTQFPGGTLKVRNKISSQYVSSLLLVSPFADAKVTLELLDLEKKSRVVDGKETVEVQAVSQPFIDMTVKMMEIWGIKVERVSAGTYVVPTGSYTNPNTFAVEADASAASYPLALAAITGGCVSVNLSAGSGVCLQGDSRFVSVLEAMGCECRQESADVMVVKGPEGGALRAVDVDMGDMTDTFMTAAVLMARASMRQPQKMISRIRGVENQRVKECNRIEATVQNLQRLGFDIREHQDGLEIRSFNSEFQSTVVIDPRHDHRLAMSFAVLSTVLPNLRIPDWRCVEKTFPTFWDMCSNDLSLEVQGLPLPSSTPSRRVIFLVGMRSVGKTTLGRSAVNAHADWELLDMDEILKPDGVDWAEFRKREVDLLARIVKCRSKDLESGQSKASCLVVACGGGIVESEGARALLRSEPLVVWVKRCEKAIVSYASKDRASKPPVPGCFEERYKMRAPYYAEVSKFEFITPDVELEDPQGITSFNNYLTRIAMPSVHFRGSLFGCHAEPHYSASSCEQFDALEIRADLLMDQSLPLAAFHHRAHSAVPLILTLRSKEEGGAWSSDSHLSYSDFIDQAFKAAADFIDVEARVLEATPRIMDRLQEHRIPSHTRLIISKHFPNPPPSQGIEAQIRSLAKVAFQLGRRHLVKIVYNQCTSVDALRLHLAAENVRKSNTPLIVIAVANGDRAASVISRALNPILSPVALSDLHIPAVKGQPSRQPVEEAQKLLGFPAKHFVLFGNPVNKSPSPAFHTAVFESTGLGGLATYTARETTDVFDIIASLQSPRFFGASITTPLKRVAVDILSSYNDLVSVDSLSKECGAVEFPLLSHANTDVLALQSILSTEKLNQTSRLLILGAGGAACAAVVAALNAGLDKSNICLLNRTPQKAEALALQFDVKVFDKNNTQPSFDVVIGAVPSQAQHALLDACGSTPIDTARLVVDMAYMPRDTPLLQKGAQAGRKTVDGVAVLRYQAAYQAKLFLAALGRDSKLSQLEEVIAKVPF